MPPRFNGFDLIAGGFDLAVNKFSATPVEGGPRIVRFGVTQNCISVATDRPISEQYGALAVRARVRALKHERVLWPATSNACLAAHLRF